MPFIEIDGEPFHIRIDGSEKNPVLLLSNSLSSDMEMWDDQVAVWAERFR
jgi:3-oxoadipate enol-lactonase